MIHFIYTPFLGRGTGDRGNEWLKDRVDIFLKYTVQSLLSQTNKNFIHWIGWRPQDKENPLVKKLADDLWFLSTFYDYKFVFTFGGLALWDDRKEREQRDFPIRLAKILPDLTDEVQGSEYVYQTVLDSDDMYRKDVVEEIQKQPYREGGAFGYKNGYLMNYDTGETAEWNPLTCPPFYTIMFLAKTFLDPEKHAEYIKYYKSHEEVAEKLNFEYLPGRKYIVGIHGKNIRTPWNHRFRGKEVKVNLKDFI